MATTYTNPYPGAYPQQPPRFYNPCGTAAVAQRREDAYRMEQQQEMMRQRQQARRKKQAELRLWTGFVFVLGVIFVVLFVMLYWQFKSHFGSLPSIPSAVSSLTSHFHARGTYSDITYDGDTMDDTMDGALDPKVAAEMENLREAGTPESLVALYGRNPDARDFVMAYGTEANVSHTIDLTNEISQGDIPLFYQWDKRWGYEEYGDDMMALNGCGPTCLSMVACGLSGSGTYDPLTVAEMAENGGYYTNGYGSSWTMMSELPYQMGLNVREVVFEEAPIRKELESGHPIICAMGAGDFTSTGHFIVLKGVDEDGNIIVNDPNSYTNSSHTWELSEIMPQVRNLWGYELQGGE